jgi:thiol-disulfide isomerase/thioredoxin
MDTNTKKNLVWAIRIIVAAVFVLSAVGKLSIDSLLDKPLFALQNFERNFLVNGIGLSYDSANIFSRLLIGLEFSLAILILIPYYLRKIVFPVTIALLGIFSVHLLIQSIGGEASNCGCFGELIPMSPLQALIKNLITIGLLLLPLTTLKEGLIEKKSFVPLIIINLTVWILMFVLLPTGSSNDVANEEVLDEVTVGIDSGYSGYFENINEGGKLLCFFSPTCEHCQETGKVLTELSSKYPEVFPEIRILFMDEAGDGSPTDIKAYFEVIGAEYPYKVLSIEEYIPVFWEKHNFPGVKYLYNGEVRAYFSGTKEQKFDAEELFDVDKLLEEIKKEK